MANKIEDGGFRRIDQDLLATMAVRMKTLEEADAEKEKRIESLEQKIQTYDKAAAKMGGIGIALIGVFSVVMYGWQAVLDKLQGILPK